MNENSNERSHNHRPDRHRSNAHTPGSGGSHPKDDFNKEMLERILAACWLDDYLEVAAHHCRDTYSESPSCQMRWRKLAGLLEIARDLANDLRQDQSAKYEKRQLIINVDSEGFFKDNPWATESDLREYRLYLNEHFRSYMPNPLKSNSFQLRQRIWEVENQ